MKKIYYSKRVPVKSNTITKLLVTGRVKSVFIPEVGKKTPSFAYLIPLNGIIEAWNISNIG